jgi:hypothetical protein
MADKNKKTIGNLLSFMAMGIGEGMTGRPFLSNYVATQAEQEGEERKAKEAMAQFQQEQALKQQALGQEQQKNMFDRAYKMKMINQGVPVYTFGAEGTPQMVGNVPKGSKVVPPAQMIAQQKFDLEKSDKAQQTQAKSQFVKESAYDTLKTIEEVEKGIGNFGLTGGLPSIPGTDRMNWEVNVNKLLSGKVINLMTTMKEASKTGATGFGQLSEKELAVLKEASTALKRGLSPKDAQRYLNDMKKTLNKIADPEYDKYLKAIGGK